MTDILLFILCPLAGYLLSRCLTKSLQRKENFWQNLYTFAKELNNNVQFSKSSIAEFANEFNKKYTCDGACKLIEQCVIDSDKSGELSQVEGYGKDNAMLQQFFSGLYQPNSQALTEHLTTYTELFEDRWHKERTNNQKLLPMYPKLGILLGIAIALILM